MNPGNEPSQTAGTLSTLEAERLLATVAGAPPSVPVPAVPSPADSPARDSAESADFRNPMLLAPGVLRKLRLHQEEFVRELAARLSMFLRLEVNLKLDALQTISCRKFTQSWANPTNLCLFKLEPLRGLSVLEIPVGLALCMVDRLMGGPGRAPEHAPEISEIERALLEQVEHLVLGEWCGRWLKVRELKPVILSHETNPRFVQVAAPETIMFVLSIQARIGEHTENIRLSTPFAALEPVIQQLARGADASADSGAAAQSKPAPPWNPVLGDLCVPVTAQWHATDMAARDVLALKVGDVIRMDQPGAGQIILRLGDVPRFQGRPGTVGGNWAVELTQRLKD